MSVQQAFNNFISDYDKFRGAVDQSTVASWGGSGYSVELFDDGTFRILWDQQIGNLYDSPGLILGIPALVDDEWDEDPDLRFYDNAEEFMKESFADHCSANLRTQDWIANS